MRNTDIILLIPLLWGTYRGFIRGFIREITSIVALALVLYISIKYTEAFANVLQQHVGKNMTHLSVTVAAFVILFIGLLLLIYFIAQRIEKLSGALHLSLINHMIGGVFGFLKWTILVSIAISYMAIFTERSGIKLIKFNDSWTYNQISGIAPQIFPGYFKSPPKEKKR